VYLTDAIGRFPEQDPGYPVIWVCEGEYYKDKKYTPPFGRTVEIHP
jgi:hypothetical protein